MKKKNIALIALSTVMAAALSVGVLAACDDGKEVKPSALEEGVNCYYGDGKDVHLKGWISSTTNDAWTIEENYTDAEAEGSPVVTKLGYSKNDAWRNFGVQIDGEYSDFAYLNITMRAEARASERPVSVNMKIVNPVTGRENMNVLGSDLYFDVSSDAYVTYTFEIPSVYRQILDIVKDVCLFPDPGIANGDSIYAGDIFVKDMWFSKERPADAYTPVDDTWRTEAWCGYTVTRGGVSEAVISYNNPAAWSRFYRPIPKEELEGNNMLKLQFTSDTVVIGETTYADSVEQFQLGLFGDMRPDGSGQYYQGWFGQYARDGFSNGSCSNNDTMMKVEKDASTGVITLTCQIASLLSSGELAGNYNDQLWLVFNLESQPQDGTGYVHENVPFDRVGQMTILSSELYYDEEQGGIVEPPENDSGWTGTSAGYVISSEKEGVDANVTYSGIGYESWVVLAYDVNEEQSAAKTVTLALRNNGTENIHVRARVDTANSTAASGDANLTIAPGETQNAVISVNEIFKTIVIFLDSHNFEGGSAGETYSGDMDIISVEFSDEAVETPDPNPEPEPEPDPEPVNGWGVVENGAGKYMISGKDGVLANVRYEGVTPSLWANLYRDVTAEERTDIVKITLRNNGENKVLYGIDLSDESNRQYGWLKAGETETVTLTNTAVYGVINFFLDCCYQGDYTTDQETLSGNIDIVSLEFVEDVAPDPDPEPDPDPSALNWTTNAANLSVKNGVVTLNDLMDGAWQNVSADLTLDAGGKITIPVTNNTNAIAKFKLSVMYNDDQGGWSDLEGNGTTVCWLEIPKGETWNMELTVSASDAPKVAHIMLMVACWDKDGTQADGTTPRPEPPYTGTVTIGAMTFAAEAGAVTEKEVDLTYTLAGAEDPSTTIEGNKITYNDLAIGSWNAGIRADYQMESGYTKISFTFKNNSDHAVRMHVAARASDWSTEFGTQRTIIEAGKTATVTLTLTAEQAAQVSILSFYCDCWEEWSEDYAQRPQDGEGNYLTALSGEIVVESVKVS